MRHLLYFGAICGALAALAGAAQHDWITVAIGVVSGIANHWMAENYEKLEG